MTRPEHRTTTTADGVAWPAPGPGTWLSGVDHVAHPVTASFIELYEPERTEGMREMFEHYGFPAAGYAAGFVNGWMYDRLVPLVGADSDKKAPPAPVLWLAMRLHPEFRSRTKVMAATFGRPRRWEAELADWTDRDAAAEREANLALTDVDPVALRDDELVEHFDAVVTRYREGVRRHFRMKGIDSVPLGDLLAATNACGIPVDEVVGLLRGASPASATPPALTAVADCVRASGTRPASLADVRAIGPEAASALDAFLREHGMCVVTGYDVDGACLAELPDVVLRSIMALVDNPVPPAPVPPAEAVRTLFDRVPADRQAEIEERFALVHATYGVRDQNGPLTFQWPLGLLRRVMIEMGRRLHARDLLEEVEHAIELDTRELRGHFLDPDPALPAKAAARAATRRDQARLRPPEVLGAPLEPAPLAVMPAPLARGVRAIEAFLAAMTGKRDQRQPLRGVGIGALRGSGRAVIAHSPEEAFERLEPGDILVATCTTPAYNAVLPIVGGIVTEEGGELSHAAIVARELGIPAVVGVVDAMQTIRDGEHVELDTVTGTIDVKREPVLTG